MRRLAVVLLVSLVASSWTQSAAQQSASSRDPQAFAVLQQAITAMGGSAPSDSTASGTITTNSGSSTDNGTFLIMTRGTGQTSEQIQTAHEAVTLVYSQESAAQVQDGNLTALPIESAVTSQSALFPLPLLIGMLNDPDSAYSYVGLETFNGASVHHVQVWTSFASIPTLAPLASFSTHDLWLDATSGIPLRISYNNHLGQGAANSVAFDVMLSNYQGVNGIQFPFLITKSVNGTPWATITINSVVFNTGLTDANFPVN